MTNSHHEARVGVFTCPRSFACTLASVTPVTPNRCAASIRPEAAGWREGGEEEEEGRRTSDGRHEFLVLRAPRPLLHHAGTTLRGGGLRLREARGTVMGLAAAASSGSAAEGPSTRTLLLASANAAFSAPQSEAKRVRCDRMRFMPAADTLPADWNLTSAAGGGGRRSPRSLGARTFP
jgi:hypothetical protein